MLISVAQLFLGLTILVTLHELGHFLPARWFGIRVKKFYLFFDFLFPFANIANFSLFKKQIGDTEYGLGWFPFGGYVQIDGMMDETQDGEEFSSTPPQSWEFRSKPAWQRLIVMIGGVTVNYFLGIFIMSMIAFVWGEDHLPVENMMHGVSCDTLALRAGFKNGDKLVSIDNQPIAHFAKFRSEVYDKKPKNVQIIREGNKMDLPISEEIADKLLIYKGSFLSERFPFIVDSVDIEGVNGKNALSTTIKAADSTVKVGNLQRGDTIIGMTTALSAQDTNATVVNSHFFEDIRTEVQKHKGSPALLTLVRPTATGVDTIKTLMNISKEGTMGVMPERLDKIFTYKHIDFSLLECLPRGFFRANEVLVKNVQGMGKIFSGKASASENVGGFGSMSKLYGKTWDWMHFWLVTGLISMLLAFMNILPIPMLDGGYIMFLLYEMVTGKEPNRKFMEYAQTVGLVIVLGLLVFSNGMDIYRGIFGK